MTVPSPCSGWARPARRSPATWSPPVPTSAATTRRSTLRGRRRRPRRARRTRCADADLVLSANSSHDAVPALVNALPGLRCRHHLGRPQHRRAAGEGAAGGGARRPATWRWWTSRSCRRCPAQRARARRCWCPARAPTATPRSSRGLGADGHVQPGPPGDGDLAQAPAQRLLQGSGGRGRRGARGRRGRRAARTGCAATSAPSWRASTSTPSTGSSTARTRTPGAEPTRWPPAPSSSTALGVPARIATAARDQLTELRDRAHA